jgi:uncharacterized protein YprB with RNaseH-like and TPR domain
MASLCEAYLDIETTGLSWRSSAITVVGLYLVTDEEPYLLQLVDRAITRESLTAALNGVNTVYTYNGTRFDLPFIRSALGAHIAGLCSHRDLVNDCWKNKLYGGLKAVENRLGIQRKTEGITGRDAVKLWRSYQRNGDRKALDLLLQYNKEDVINLKLLRERLAEFSAGFHGGSDVA